MNEWYENGHDSKRAELGGRMRDRRITESEVPSLFWFLSHTYETLGACCKGHAQLVPVCFVISLLLILSEIFRLYNLSHKFRLWTHSVLLIFH